MKKRDCCLRNAIGLGIMLGSFFLVACSSVLAPVNSGSDGIAIKGYDPVAYFIMGKPVKGDDTFTYEWNGARWLFAGQEHLELFSADPEMYAPQYGGY